VVLRRLRRDRLTLAAAGFLVVLAVVAIAAPLIVDVFGVRARTSAIPAL
jgi:hypothetical protein